MDDDTCWYPAGNLYQTREGRILGDLERICPPSRLSTTFQLVPDQVDVSELQGQMPLCPASAFGQRCTCWPISY